MIHTQDNDMKKKILTFILGSSFIFADCISFITNANSSDQSACVKATECLKNEITLLIDTLQKLEATSKSLDNEINKSEHAIERCENWEAYSKKEPTVKRWQILAEDCQTHYIQLSKLMMAKRHLNVINNTERLKRQIEFCGASLPYIKDKCHNFTSSKIVKENISTSELKLGEIGYSLDGCNTFIKLTHTNQLGCMRAKVCLENEIEELYILQRHLTYSDSLTQEVAKSQLIMMKKDPNLLNKEIKASNASLEYIKDKCKF